MRLLFLSTIRHIRKHFFQTIITFLITFIFVSMLSAIFHFAIGFQGALRQYSIDTVGTYHYKWIGKQEELGFMEEMAAQAKEDPWFSEVCLKQQNQGYLQLAQCIKNLIIFFRKCLFAEQRITGICWYLTGTYGKKMEVILF